MFRFAFVLFILGLSIYGIFSLFSPLRQVSNTENFDTYLTQALERNTRKEVTHNIAFSLSLPGEETIASSRTLPHTFFNQDYSVSPNNALIVKTQESEFSAHTKRVLLPQSNLSANLSSSSFATSGQNCAGLIYTPCVTL